MERTSYTPYANVADYAKPLFYRTLKRAFNDISKTNKRLSGLDRDMEAIHSFVLSGEDPNERFNILDLGSYKVAYEMPNNRNYIFKLCSSKNDTEAERAILEAAKEDELDYAFVSTYFIPLFGMKCKIPDLPEGFSEGTYIEIQPYIETATEEQWAAEKEFIPEDAYCVDIKKCRGTYKLVEREDKRSYDPLCDPNTHEQISYNTCKALGISNRKWLESFLNLYGVEELEKLAAFVGRYYIYDLHDGNLGYLWQQGIYYPVILDWLSGEFVDK